MIDGGNRVLPQLLLGGNLRLQPDLAATSFCLGDGDELDAMGFWTRPESPQAGSLAKLRAGVLATPFRLGLHGVRRLAEVVGGIDRHRDEALAGRRFWFLNNMAVREELRGTGVGSALLGEQLRQLAEREPGAATALAT